MPKPTIKVAMIIILKPSLWNIIIELVVSK